MKRPTMFDLARELRAKMEAFFDAGGEATIADLSARFEVAPHRIKCQIDRLREEGTIEVTGLREVYTPAGKRCPDANVYAKRRPVSRGSLLHFALASRTPLELAWAGAQ